MIIGKHYITQEEKTERLEKLRGYSFLSLPESSQRVKDFGVFIHNALIVLKAVSSYVWAEVRATYYRFTKRHLKAAEILLDSMAYTSKLGTQLIKKPVSK